MMTRKLTALVMVAGLALGTFGCKKKEAADEGKDKADMKAEAMDDEMKADDMKADDMKADDMKADEPKAGAKTNEDKLQGEWIVDFEKMKAADPDVAKAKPEDQKKMADALAKMVIKVEKGKLEMTDPEGKTEKATYVVKSQEGNKMVVETKEEGGKQKVETETFEFTDDDSIVVSKAGDKDKMYLKRKK